MATATDLLPDDVWHALDPDAGRLSRRARFRLGISAAGALAVLVAAIVCWQSGVVVPHLAAQLPGWGADPVRRVVTVDVELSNQGWQSVRVLGIGRSGPGMDLQSVDTVFPVDLPPSTGIQIELTYRVTDCAAVPQGSWPLPVHVQRSWGSMTTAVALPDIVPAGTAPAGTRSYTGRDPYSRNWQAGLAYEACHPEPVSP
jgi:hypothetical protein